MVRFIVQVMGKQETDFVAIETVASIEWPYGPIARHEPLVSVGALDISKRKGRCGPWDVLARSKCLSSPLEVLQE